MRVCIGIGEITLNCHTLAVSFSRCSFYFKLFTSNLLFVCSSTFSCFKWPVGEASSSGSNGNGGGGGAQTSNSSTSPAAIVTSDAAQQALVTLLELLAKVLNPSAAQGTGLFLFGSGAGGAGPNNTSSPSPPSSLATSAFTAAYSEVVQQLRAELAFVLHVTLEWMATTISSGDAARVSKAMFVNQFLVTMIVHRIALTSGAVNASLSDTAAADANDLQGSADLILKYIKFLLYHPGGEKLVSE